MGIKMIILYGINGEGLGHIKRSNKIIEELKSAGHTVHIACMNDSILTKNDIKIGGVRLKFKNQKIKKLSTIIDFFKLPINKYISSIEAKYGVVDLVITDFEPITARYARKNKINLVSIDNQHRFAKIDKRLPFKYWIYNILLSVLLKVFIGKVNDYIITCFYPEKDSVGTVCVDQTVSDNHFTLVYLKDEFIDKFINAYSFDDFTYVYCKSAEKFKTKYFNKNLIFCELDNINFSKMLKNCSRVISNAGNQITGECVYYNKPITCIPVKGQIEQEINGFYLEYYNLGKVSNLDELVINNKKPDANIENGIRKIMERLEQWLK